MNILDEIRATKQKEVQELARRTTRSELQKAAVSIPTPRDLRSALPRGGRGIIAEVKRASPSKGVIDAALDPASLASQYVSGGAEAVSVLTDPTYFHGSAGDFSAVRKTVDVPLLRKDFILDPLQVLESRAMGADVILLIVRMVSDDALRELLGTAHDLGMQALVEVHDERELDRAVAVGAPVIGVNNRDLDTFEVTRETSLRLREKMPHDVLSVSESGILLPSEAAELFAAGYDAVLVGEGLVRAADKRSFIRALRAA